MSDKINNEATLFNFQVFDIEDGNKSEKEIVDEHNELYKFKINKKKFITEDFFQSSGKTKFAPMFTADGINKKSYEEQLDEYYNKRKEEIEIELSNYFNEKKAEADKILKEAVENSEKLLREKEREGFDKGYKEGFDKGYGEIIEKESLNFEKFGQLIKTLSLKEKELVNGAEKQICNLIVKLAEKIIKKEVETESKEILFNNIRETLKKLVDKNEITIYVSNEDYSFLVKNKDKIKDAFDMENVKILKSDKISSGGVIVESSFGTLDATLESQLSEFEQMLNG